MATTRRRQSPNLVERLCAEPWRFSFQQAVRILEAAVCSNDPRSAGFASGSLAGLTPPHKELLHFSNRPSLAFSAANISAVEAVEASADKSQQQWHMALQFMGLAGSHGVMPHYFSEILLQRLRDKDEALAAFINIFEHRSISLFYRASGKYRLPHQYENSRRQQHKDDDPFTHALACLSGLGSPHLAAQLPLDKEAILGYSGLYARPIRSAAALKGMLEHYFGLQADIEQFCGQWQALPDDIVTHLPGEGFPDGQNNCLGANALLGTSCWQVQSKFRIRLAPMDYPSFMALAPGSKKLLALQSFIDFFTGTELDYEICVQLQWQDAKPTRLDNSVGSEPLLGWNTPLGRNPDAAKNKKPIEILVSKHTLPADAGLAVAV